MFLDPDISEDTWVFQVRRPDAPSEWNICQQNIWIHSASMGNVYVNISNLGAYQMMIGMYNPLLGKVFRFHYHSQKVIGSLGYTILYVSPTWKS